MSEKIFSSFSFRLYIGCIAAFGIISGMLILPALPTIELEFGRESGAAIWTVTAFMLGSTFGHFFWGPISDRCGRALPLYWGLSIAAVACVLCFSSETATSMILARFMQGFGSAAGNTLARAICRDCYTGRFFEQMIAWVFTIIPLASGVSPLIGSVIQGAFGWRACFIFLFLISALLIGLTAIFLRPLPILKQEFSIKKMGQEYYLILNSSQNIWILLSISFVFVGFFIFLTGFPSFLNRIYTLEDWSTPLLFTVFPLGTFVGGLYQSTWGWLKSSEKSLRVCWTLIFWALVLSFVLLFFQGTAILLYAGLMMLFGGGMAVFNALHSSLLMRRNKPTIAGTLSSVMGIFQTLSGALGSFLASVTLTPFSSITLICVSTFCCFLCYRRVRWDHKEAYLVLVHAPLSQ